MFNPFRKEAKKESVIEKSPQRLAIIVDIEEPRDIFDEKLDKEPEVIKENE